MATVEQCRTALEELSGRLGGADGEAGRAVRLDRSLSCRITDLGVTFSGRLHEGALHDVTTQERPRARIRLAMSSDDLVALVAGELDFAPAWARGRVRLDASIKDLLVLRKIV